MRIIKIIERVLSWTAYPIARLLVIGKPIDRNKYFCISMGGNSYGDNIKCLSDYLIANVPDARVVWGFTSSFYDCSGCELKRVKLYTIDYYKEILTSKYILSNNRLNQRMFHKRKGQIYLQTWHGTALKRIGKDARKSRPWYKRIIQPPMLEFDVDNTDIMISGSGFMTGIYREKFGFKGVMWEVGTPRNDIFFKDLPEIVTKVHSFYSIPDETQIILYAPTFRSDGSFEYYDIDAKKLMSLWERQTGKKCVFLARLHPNIANKESDLKKLFPSETIYASSYPDMQELLYATDLLVTDYSSSMFDYMYSGKPVLMYIPDWDNYERGFYFTKEELPFVMVRNNNELKEAIEKVDLSGYCSLFNNFLKKIDSKETGNATRITINNLIKYARF